MEASADRALAPQAERGVGLDLRVGSSRLLAPVSGSPGAEPLETKVLPMRRSRRDASGGTATWWALLETVALAATFGSVGTSSTR